MMENSEKPGFFLGASGNMEKLANIKIIHFRKNSFRKIEKSY